MDDKLFDILDDLNIRDTKLLLDEDINLSLDSYTRKRIEKSIKKKTGYYRENNIHKEKINNILGGIFMKKKIALALSATVILSLVGGGYAYAKTPVAYVSMDINPSVELGVNAFDTVVSVEAYNEDGEKILEGTDLVNTDVEDAVSTVISNAISEGYINEDGSSAIEITTSTDKENVAIELDESLKEVAEVTLDDNNVEAEVETEKVALVRRDEARKLGITPGKLNLIQKLQQLDSSITIEDYKDSSVKDIQKKTKELRKNNKSQEATTEVGTSTDTKADATDGTTDTTTDAVTEQGTLSETSNDLEKVKIVEPEKNNNGNAKKEENNNVNSNSKKEENSNTNGNEEKKETTTTTEKQNNSNNVKSQENSNSSKSENSSSSDSKGNSSNSNVSKASKSNNGNSSSENKGNSKNKN